MTDLFPHTVATSSTRRRLGVAGGLTVVTAVVTAAALLGQGAPAGAAQAPVGLGVADSFAVLAGSTVTNVGPSTVSGDVGVSPGSQTPGLTAAMVTGGTIHRADPTAASAQDDLTTAYVSAAGRGPTTAVPTELGGRTLTAGVYSGPTLAITGALTLDAQGDPAAVFVFQTSSTLLAGTGSTVRLTNGADACRVFWQVGSSATLGTDAGFAGSVLALTSITANTGATVRGRLLARNGAVTLDDNDITRPDCATPTAPSTSPSADTPSTGSAPATPSSTTADPSAPAPSTTVANPGTDTAPTAGGLSPSTGPASGGTPVQVDGTGFVPGSTTVTIGGTPVTDVDVENPTSLTFVTPPGSPSRTTVVVTTPSGSTPPTGLTFTYVDRTTLAATGTDDLDHAVGAAVLIASGLLILLVARTPRRGRHRT